MALTRSQPSKQRRARTQRRRVSTKPAVKRRRNNNRNRPRRERHDIGMQMIGTAVTSPRQQKPTEGIKIQGKTTVYMNANVTSAAYPAGSLVAQMQIDPSMAANLALQAKCYQEIKYNYLNILVPGQAGSTTQGSGVVSFCADADDTLPSGIDSNQIPKSVTWSNGQAHSMQGKFWETLDFTVPHSSMKGPSNGYFKTNGGKNAATTGRTYSPGFLSYVIVFPPSAPVPVEIIVEWEVLLRGPTMPSEDVLAPAVVTALRDVGIDANATADVPLVQSLFVYRPTKRVALATDFSPALAPDVYYFIPGGPRTVTANTGATGGPEAQIMTHFGLHTTGTEIRFYHYNITSGTWSPLGITVMPQIGAAPVIRADSECQPDPTSPGFGN